MDEMSEHGSEPPAERAEGQTAEKELAKEEGVSVPGTRVQRGSRLLPQRLRTLLILESCEERSEPLPRFIVSA